LGQFLWHFFILSFSPHSVSFFVNPIEQLLKVKGEASLDDPSLNDYWEKRHQKFGKSYWEKNSRNYKIAQTQNWQCPNCGAPLFNGEEINTHHIVPVAQGGLDDI
jgi:RNA-directed DNA polymerase